MSLLGLNLFNASFVADKTSKFSLTFCDFTPKYKRVFMRQFFVIQIIGFQSLFLLSSKVFRNGC